MERNTRHWLIHPLNASRARPCRLPTPNAAFRDPGPITTCPGVINNSSAGPLASCRLPVHSPGQSDSTDLVSPPPEQILPRAPKPEQRASSLRDIRGASGYQLDFGGGVSSSGFPFSLEASSSLPSRGTGESGRRCNWEPRRHLHKASIGGSRAFPEDGAGSPSLSPSHEKRKGRTERPNAVSGPLSGDPIASPVPTERCLPRPAAAWADRRVLRNSL